MNIQFTSFPKLIYFAYKNTKLSRYEFISRWRQHGYLGISLPRWKNIYKYSQCIALKKAISVKNNIIKCNGVAVVFYKSEKSRIDHISDKDSSSIMKTDEQKTFSKMVRDCSILTNEQLIVTEKNLKFTYKIFFCFWKKKYYLNKFIFKQWNIYINNILVKFLKKKINKFELKFNYLRLNHPHPKKFENCIIIAELSINKIDQINIFLNQILLNSNLMALSKEIDIIITKENELYKS